MVVDAAFPVFGRVRQIADRFLDRHMRAQLRRASSGAPCVARRQPDLAPVLENGAQLEDVQKAAGHRDPDTTKL